MTNERGMSRLAWVGVLAFLGILVAVALPGQSRSIFRAKQAKAMDEMRARSADLRKLCDRDGACPATIAPGPTDPWGHSYAYEADGKSFTLRCLGRDGEPSAGITPETRDEFDLDIVLVDGRFVSAPTR